MKIPFTHKMLEDWSGERTYRDAKILFDSNRVETVKYEHPFVSGMLAIGPRGMKTKFEMTKDGLIENHCPCRASREQGIICTHIIALGMEFIRRNTDPLAKEKAEQEKRTAERINNYKETDYLRRVPAGTINGKESRLKLSLAKNWIEGQGTGHVLMKVTIFVEGKPKTPEEINTRMPLVFSEQDENLLYLLEDICEGPIKSSFGVKSSDFINILQLHSGKSLPIGGISEPATVNSVKMNSMLQLDMDGKTGELLMSIYTELPYQRVDEIPVYIVGHNSGWIYHSGNFWPLRKILPVPLHHIYHESVRVPRVAIPNFFKVELPMLKEQIHVVEAISEDLITMEPEMPTFHLEILGSEGAIKAKLVAVYDDIVLTVCRPDPNSNFAHADPNDLMRYTVRNPAAETRALQRINQLGFKGDFGDQLLSIKEQRNVLNFIGSGLPKLRRMG